MIDFEIIQMPDQQYALIPLDALLMSQQLVMNKDFFLNISLNLLLQFLSKPKIHLNKQYSK